MNNKITEGFIRLDNQDFYQIENYTNMPPFFMTLTSSSNHWMFLSSSGGVTCGRKSAESSLFPYYTDDRVTENITNTGPYTAVIVEHDNTKKLWKPFSEDSEYKRSSFLLKNVCGNIIGFKETNFDLNLSFSYFWMSSKKYGIIRKSVVENVSDKSVTINILDGYRNILPAGVTTQTQSEFSCLLNGYKRNELDPSGLGIFTLSATLTDLAEPSESLRATTVWHTGLENPKYLISEEQLKSFSQTGSIIEESDIKGERGAFFVNSEFKLNGNCAKEWIIVADLEQDLTKVNNTVYRLMVNNNILSHVLDDVKLGTNELNNILLQNDGIQKSGNIMNSVHHCANVLFNVMRGGYFYNPQYIDIKDFYNYLEVSNKVVAKRYKDTLDNMGPHVTFSKLTTLINGFNDSSLIRLWNDYLPLTFSRRHGDPSRPWNKFSIETTKEDGGVKLDYQGNWRDIFQNWEALSQSYPYYIEHFLSKFFNASTRDGYNPYRISKNGIDWECPEPDNPWANIGYWSDHQIIYLLKLLELYKDYYPNQLTETLNKRQYSYANVPYRIKPFNQIIDDPYNTIIFDETKNHNIEEFVKEIGSDGRMLHSKSGKIVLGSITEKLLIHLLTKLGNFIPEGGVWMNTQRPEWNDANNALVGKGVSVVTLGYLRRYVDFMLSLYSLKKEESFTLTTDLIEWFNSQKIEFTNYNQTLGDGISDSDRFKIVKSLGLSSQKFREGYYNHEAFVDGEVSGSEIVQLLKTVIGVIDDSLIKNRREDNLYHSYNTMSINGETLKINYLYEMLEGQVSILSSGFLNYKEALKTMDAVKNSALYREDQNSYMLYPNRELPGFRRKNVIKAELAKKLPNLESIITRDINGESHFNGSFRNVKSLRSALEKEGYKSNSELELIFEDTFNHSSFTGRSGTFFAYEGLGSIYWHMVSKLLLAVQENYFWAKNHNAPEDDLSNILEFYKNVRSGLGYKKSAYKYGTFPFDPYSHSPYNKGAKQPGMTGQVKEEILTRLKESGLYIKNGEITFDKDFIEMDDFITSEVNWEVEIPSGEKVFIPIVSGSFAGTYCQTPFVVTKSESNRITLYTKDKSIEFVGNRIPSDYSSSIFSRTGDIKYIQVYMKF